MDELGKKIKILRKDPFKVGGNLSGKLKGKKSTRLVRKYRLVFSMDSDSKSVYLEDVDHRKGVY